VTAKAADAQDRSRRDRDGTLSRDGPRRELGADEEGVRRHRRARRLHEAETAVEAATEAHARGETDEFIEPTLVASAPALADGDAVVFFNFRADRARQLVRMLTDTRPDWTFDLDQPGIRMTTMTEYDETFAFPVAFPPQMPANTIGGRLRGGTHPTPDRRVGEVPRT